MATINREFASKVLETVSAGLVSGLGERKPGSMCVEAAICYAMDLPHSDSPTCVGSAVRSFMIRLNDASWPSDEARTEGLRKLSIAQLGSDTIDQGEFRRIVVIQTIRKIVPIALRAAAKMNPAFADELEGHAKACKSAPDGLPGAREVVLAAREVAIKARKGADAAYAAADAAAYAAYAADAAAYAAADAADAVAYAAADAADAAYAAADAAAYDRLAVLQTAAQIGLDALIELKSPGVEFLDLVQS